MRANRSLFSTSDFSVAGKARLGWLCILALLLLRHQRGKRPKHTLKHDDARAKKTSMLKMLMSTFHATRGNFISLGFPTR
jgi:hypothetical protein